MVFRARGGGASWWIFLHCRHYSVQTKGCIMCGVQSIIQATEMKEEEVDLWKESNQERKATGSDCWMVIRCQRCKQV